MSGSITVDDAMNEAVDAAFDNDEELDSLLFDEEWPPIVDVHDGSVLDVHSDIDADMLVLDDHSQCLSYQQSKHGYSPNARPVQSAEEMNQCLFDTLAEVLESGKEQLTLPIYARRKPSGPTIAQSNECRARRPLCFPAATAHEAWRFSQAFS